MEKKTFELCLSVLERFNNVGLLRHIILIGSWCIYFYKNYFKTDSYSTFIRTREVDFLVPFPFNLNKNIDVFKIIEDLGFVEEYRGTKGYTKLQHPDLTVEFLVPERGRGIDKPYRISQLGINAVAYFLALNTID